MSTTIPANSFSEIITVQECQQHRNARDKATTWEAPHVWFFPTHEESSGMCVSPNQVPTYSVQGWQIPVFFLWCKHSSVRKPENFIPSFTGEKNRQQCSVAKQKLWRELGGGGSKCFPAMCTPSAESWTRPMLNAELQTESTSPRIVATSMAWDVFS